MLIATLLDQAEVLQVVAAALRGTVALVPLDQEPEAGQAQVIELRASGLAIPIVLLGRLEGEPVAGMYPVRFKPLSGSHASDLRAFLRGGGTWPATPTPVHAVEPAQPGQTGTPGTYRVGAGREPAVVIPPAPTGTVREPLVPIDTLTDQARDASPLELVFGAPAREPSGITAAPPRREDALSDVASLASAAGTARASAGVPPPIPADAVGPASEETADFVGEPITTTDLTRPPVDDDRTIVEPATVGAEPTPSPPRTAPATPPRPPEPAERERTFQGRVLSGGKYFLQQHIGSGGSGRVYKAYHRELETTIAIKLLHELRQEDDRFAARFRREALATSKLDHANVMRVMDFGREQDGLLYIVMEYLDGPNLQRIIDLEAPLPLPRIVAIMSQVCAALAAAHHIGLIRRRTSSSCSAATTTARPRTWSRSATSASRRSRSRGATSTTSRAGT